MKVNHYPLPEVHEHRELALELITDMFCDARAENLDPLVTFQAWCEELISWGRTHAGAGNKASEMEAVRVFLEIVSKEMGKIIKEEA